MNTVLFGMDICGMWTKLAKLQVFKNKNKIQFMVQILNIENFEFRYTRNERNKEQKKKPGVDVGKNL